MNDLAEETDQTDRDDYARGDRGQFAAGTRGGPGRPPGYSPMGAFRKRLLEAVTPQDIDACVVALRDIISDADARPGERLAAIREMLDRAVGKPSPGDLGELVAEVEKMLGGGDG